MRGGMRVVEAARKATIFQTCSARLAQINASGNAHRLFVPGRIEFLGKHTDYAGGRSLICATERGLCVVAAPRDDDAIRIVDSQRDEEANFHFSAKLTPAVGHWSNYPMTVARRVARNFGPNLRG